MTEHHELKKNIDLEALRVVAIAFTLMAHIGMILSPESSYWIAFKFARFGSGVDLFFCISGYIITRSIMREIPDWPSWRAFVDLAIPFWKRRVYRLLPASLLWVAVSLVACAVWGGDGIFPSMTNAWKAASAAVFQYFNDYWLTCRSAYTCGTLGAYWSLSLENQFYFLLPIAAGLLTKRWLPFLFTAIFAAQVFLPRNITQYGTLDLWVFRTDAISLGVLLAFLKNDGVYGRINPTGLNDRVRAAAAFFVLCMALAVFTSPQPRIQMQTGLAAVVSLILVWIASYDAGYIVRNERLKAICAYLGSRSYSIYLSHMFVLFIVLKVRRYGDWMPSSYDLPTMVVFLSITWVMTEASYRWVERPFITAYRSKTSHLAVAERA